MTTRASVEVVLLRRTGRMLTKAGLDGVTDDGTNVDLNDPIGWAVRTLGYPVADVTEVSSDEVEAVPSGKVNALLDLAELRTLESILGNLDLVSAQVGPRREELNDLARRLNERIPRKRKEIEQEHDIPLGERKPARFDVDARN